MRRLSSSWVPGTTLALALALAVAVPGRAHADQSLSLMDALRKAVAGNIDLLRERVNIQINAANYLQARGQFDTLLTGGLNFSRATQPPLSKNDLAGGFTNTLTLDLGATRALESGGSLSLALREQAFNTNSPFSCGGTASGASASCVFYASSLNLTFSHPLLRGFGLEIAQANLRKQRVVQDIALLNRQLRAANVIRDVVSMYWELAYATQDLAIRRSAVELAREQLKATQAQIEVGRLAPMDAAAVERAIADRQQDVAVSEQSLFLRTLDLRRAFGEPVDGGTASFVASEVPDATPHQADVPGSIGRALQSNPQLRSLRMGLKLNQIDIEAAENNLKPRLDFLGQFGAAGRNTSLMDTLAQTAGLDNLTLSAGLTFQLPVENRSMLGGLEATRRNAQSAQLSVVDLENSIRDSVVRLAFAVRTASRRLELARATVGFAQKDLEAEKARFDVGRSTNNDVLLRQQALKAAEIQVVRSVVDLINSDTALGAVTGDVLERYDLVLKGS